MREDSLELEISKFSLELVESIKSRFNNDKPVVITTLLTSLIVYAESTGLSMQSLSDYVLKSLKDVESSKILKKDVLLN
ncbi:MAG: hypothetical protein KGO96_07245 [Elusimicrobia bacterium]|nr:hypothetical protein [Elusimicrobiota bacterium]